MTTSSASEQEHLIAAIEAHAEVINELVATLTAAKLIAEPTAAWLLERVQDGRDEIGAMRRLASPARDTAAESPTG
jgi:hypothetical protein